MAVTSLGTELAPSMTTLPSPPPQQSHCPQSQQRQRRRLRHAQTLQRQRVVRQLAAADIVDPQRQIIGQRRRVQTPLQDKAQRGSIGCERGGQTRSPQLNLRSGPYL